MYQVLLVDDETKITDWLKKSISWEKYQCTVCEVCLGGLQAIRYLENHTADIIITDIRMPGLNGLELIQMIHEKRPSVRTIILSGYNQFEYAQQALKYGVKGFLLKPLDPNELTDLLLDITSGLPGQPSFKHKTSESAFSFDLLKPDEHKTDAVLEYVNKNYNKELCLKNCADLFEFHPAYLGKIFKEATGMAFNTYLNKKRISQLKKLLTQSNLPIGQLIESVGYHNYEYFYIVFKKYEGISFSEYRGKMKETPSS